MLLLKATHNILAIFRSLKLVNNQTLLLGQLLYCIHT